MYKNLDCKVNFVNPSVISNSDGFYGIVELWRDEYEYWLATGRIQVPAYVDAPHVFDRNTGIRYWPKNNADAVFSRAKDCVDVIAQVIGFSQLADASSVFSIFQNVDVNFGASGIQKSVDTKVKFNIPDDEYADIQFTAEGFSKLVDVAFTNCKSSLVDSSFTMEGSRLHADANFICAKSNFADAIADILGVNRSLVDSVAMMEGSAFLSLMVTFDIVRELPKSTKGPFSIVVNRSDTPEQFALDRAAKQFTRTDSTGVKTTLSVTQSKKFIQLRISFVNYPDSIADNKDFAVQFDIVGEISQNIAITFDVATLQQVLRSQRLKYSITVGSISGDVVLIVVPVVSGVEQRSLLKSLSLRLLGTCGVFVFWKFVADSYNIYRADKTPSGVVLTPIQIGNTTGEFLYD